MLQRLPGWECIGSKAEGPRVATVTQSVLATTTHPVPGNVTTQHWPPPLAQCWPPNTLSPTHPDMEAIPHSELATIFCSLLATIAHLNLTILTHPAPQDPSSPLYPTGEGTTSMDGQHSQPAEPEPKSSPFHPKTVLGLRSTGKTSDQETPGCSFGSRRPGKLQGWEQEW